jgi:hypothetical protein
LVISSCALASDSRPARWQARISVKQPHQLRCFCALLGYRGQKFGTVMQPSRLSEGWRRSASLPSERPHPTFVDTTLPQCGRLVRAPALLLMRSYNGKQRAKYQVKRNCRSRGTWVSHIYDSACAGESVGNDCLMLLAQLEWDDERWSAQFHAPPRLAHSAHEAAPNMFNWLDPLDNRVARW